MTDAGSDSFTFDNFGNTASIVGVETYSYDFESHMTQREASGGSTDTHEYDGDGRRMRSKLDDAADWTNFIHDELTENLICEYTLVSGSFTIKALNTYGLGLISSNRQGTIRYFHFDGLGTTHHLTDSTQAVTDSYTYDAFGVPTSATGSSINPYRYVGQWGYYDDGAMDSTSEMLLLGVRYYWPKYGRFTVWDPIPSMARYSYVFNCPSGDVDPSGAIPSACDCEKEGLFSHVGKVFIDCSCRNLLRYMGILPERAGSQAYWRPSCGRWILADAYFTKASWNAGQRVTKIQGQSCLILACIGGYVVEYQICCRLILIPWRCRPEDVNGPSEFGKARFQKL